MADRVRVGVIGAGAIAQLRHLPAFRRCQGEGNQALSVTIGGGPAYALQVAPCEPASSTTEPESTTTTSA